MKRGKGFTRKTPLKASARPVEARKGDGRAPTKGKRPKARRKPNEWARIYGSEERVKWVKARPCDFCGRGPCDNAHITNGGTGRKADARFIVSACKDCHHELDHGIGKKAMERSYGKNLLEMAVAVEVLWRRHCGCGTH